METHDDRARPLIVRGFSRTPGKLLVTSFLDVEQASEHQKRNLFDDSERIGNAACVKFKPELIDVVLELVGNHSRFLMG